jgi:YidC/Oxa1 family membrane protein insertase
MQALQPELLKLRDKYKNDQQKYQEEMMKLYQKHNVNPLAGCLPILIQMPILLALYNAIMYNPAIRGEHSQFLWMDLSEPDKFYILPILAALTTYIQQKMITSQTPNTNNPMQGIMIIFPILIFVMSISFPSALPLYWVYSNLFTLVQTYFIYGIGKTNKEGQVKGGKS